jgi:hypothetical protein
MPLEKAATLPRLYHRFHCQRLVPQTKVTFCPNARFPSPKVIRSSPAIVTCVWSSAAGKTQSI